MNVGRGCASAGCGGRVLWWLPLFALTRWCSWPTLSAASAFRQNRYVAISLVIIILHKANRPVLRAVSSGTIHQSSSDGRRLIPMQTL